MRARDSEMGEMPKQAGEARHRKPTREVRSSAPNRAEYGGRCRDLIGQSKCGLGALIGWEPPARAHARMNGLSRTL